jgi:mobilome CxxCx(11)CxxC protein
MTTSTVQLRQDLMQKAVDGWGTAVIFERRADLYEKRLKSTAFVGFFIPLAIGAIVSAGALKWVGLETFVFALGVVAAAQAIASGCLIFAGYEQRLSTVLNSAGINKALSVRCEMLAKDLILPEDAFQIQASTLIGECIGQDHNDERLKITPEERRRAARAGFRRYGACCRQCEKIPASEDATADGSDCKTCGDF